MKLFLLKNECAPTGVKLVVTWSQGHCICSAAGAEERSLRVAGPTQRSCRCSLLWSSDFKLQAGAGRLCEQRRLSRSLRFIDVLTTTIAKLLVQEDRWRKRERHHHYYHTFLGTYRTIF